MGAGRGERGVWGVWGVRLEEATTRAASAPLPGSLVLPCTDPSTASIAATQER